jgi:hypothetical protein
MTGKKLPFIISYTIYPRFLCNGLRNTTCLRSKDVASVMRSKPYCTDYFVALVLTYQIVQSRLSLHTEILFRVNTFYIMIPWYGGQG